MNFKTFLLLIVLSVEANAQMPQFLRKFVENSKENVSISGLKTHYLAGEKLSLIASVQELSTQKATQLSVPLYIDLVDLANGKLLNRFILKLENGQASLSFSLPLGLATANYQLRAYTNWMRNFSEDGFFKQNFAVFSQNFKEEMYKANKQIDFDTLMIHAESGCLVEGLKSKIAIETKDNFGTKISVPFQLINDKNDTLVNAETDSLGIAIIDFLPKEGEKCHFVAKNKTFYLPEIKKNGTIFTVDNLSNKEKIRVFIQTNKVSSDTLTLALTQNGQLIYWKSFQNNKPSLLINIPKNEFSGTIQCLLTDAQGKELGERTIEITSNTVVDILTKDRVLLTQSPKHILYFDNEGRFPVEKGLSLKGQLSRLNGKKIKKEIQLSMVLTAPKNDTTTQKTTPFFITCKDNFSFEDLDFYGKKRVTFVAPDNKVMLDTIISIPPIYAKKLPINWKLVDKSEELVDLEKRKNAVVLENIRKSRENIMLDEVVVKAKKIDPNAISGISPDVVIEEKKIIHQYSMSSILTILMMGRSRFSKLEVFLDSQMLRKEDLDNLDFDVSPSIVEKILIFEDFVPPAYGSADCAIVIVTRRGFNYNVKPNESFIVHGYHKE